MRHTRRFACALLLVAAVAAFAGCAAPPTPVPATSTPAGAAFPVTIVDDGKTEVTLQAEPQQIVSLTPSHTEVLFALGLGDRVVGVTTFCDYPEEAKSKEKVGSFADIDLEKVVGLNPDLVLATSLHAQTVAPALRERGLTVAVLEATDVATTLEKIAIIGKLTGRAQEAAALNANIQTRLDAVAAKISQLTSRPRVYWELDAMLYSAGKDSFVDGLIDLAGGDNVGRRLAGEWPQFSLEALVEADPEVIILADHDFGETAEKVQGRPGWSGMAAVKAGRLVEVDDINLVSRPGPRVAEAVEYIARQLHPELFEGS